MFFSCDQALELELTLPPVCRALHLEKLIHISFSPNIFLGSLGIEGIIWPAFLRQNLTSCW